MALNISGEPVLIGASFKDWLIQNEIFQSLDDLEGISIENAPYGLSGISYKFKDELGQNLYEVACHKLNDGLTYLQEVQERYDINDSNLIDPTAYSITLTYNDNFGLTKRGNFAFVYNKLLTCVKHLIDTKKVDMLSFSGYVDAMDITYDRLLKQFRKTNNPNYTFYPVTNYRNISEAFILKHPLESQQNLRTIIKQATETKDSGIQDIRIEKAIERQRRAAKQTTTQARGSS